MREGLTVASIIPWAGPTDTKEERKRLKVGERIRKNRQAFFDLHSFEESRAFLETEEGCKSNCDMKEQCLCKNCEAVFGYYRKNELLSFTEEQRKDIHALFRKDTGFRRSNGCALPRTLRSLACLNQICFYCKDLDKYDIPNPHRTCQGVTDTPDIYRCTKLNQMTGFPSFTMTKNQCKQCLKNQEAYLTKEALAFYFNVLKEKTLDKYLDEAIAYVRKFSNAAEVVIAKLLVSLCLPPETSKTYKEKTEYYWKNVAKLKVGMNPFDMHADKELLYSFYERAYIEMFKSNAILAMNTICSFLERAHVLKDFPIRFIGEHKTSLPLHSDFDERFALALRLYETALERYAKGKEKPLIHKVSVLDRIKGAVGAFKRAKTKAKAEGLKAVWANEQEIIERQICCTVCTDDNTCPYCGCTIKSSWFLPLGKSDMTTEGCPSEKTYPHLSKFPTRNYWQVCTEAVTIVVDDLIYSLEYETFLRNQATGQISVIPKSKYSALDVESDYVYEVNEKIMYSKGFDTKLKCHCNGETSASVGRKDKMISSNTNPQKHKEVSNCINHDLQEEKENDLVSIIVLSRDEPYLKPTLENLIERADGPIEIIVVIDGSCDDEILEHELITYIRHNEVQGRRPSTDEAVRRAKGKYLFHVDAHVLTNTQGYDLLFKEACVDNKTMVIPNLDKLIVPDFRAKGRRMGHKYVSVKMKDEWSGFKSSKEIEPTITGNGMGWFLEKEYYEALGGCEERYGKIWGNFGLEWSFKVWLSDPDGRGAGQVLLHKKIVFAHMWKKPVGYKTPGAGSGRSRLWDWVEGKAKNQVRDFSFFEENFGHLLPNQKEPNKMPLRKNEVTVIMNTNGMYPHLIEEAVDSFLRQSYIAKKLLIVCTHPDGLKLDKEYDTIEIMNIKPPPSFPEQIAFAIKQVKTRYWSVMDSDDIFFPNHLSQLMEGVRQAKEQEMPSPFYVKVPRAWQKRGWELHERKAGWWTCMYEKMRDEDVDLALEKHRKKYKGANSFDLIIRGLRMWNQYVMHDAESTVLHRLGVASHIGFSGKSPNRYQELLEEAAKQDVPTIVPQWHDDYYKIVGKKHVIKVYSNNHLGDALTMEPCIRNIRSHNPSAIIEVYTKWPELFKNHPEVNKVGYCEDSHGFTYKLGIRKRTHLCTWLDQSTGYPTPEDPQHLLPRLYLDDKQRSTIADFNVEWEKPIIAFSIRTHATSKRWDKTKWLAIVKWVESMGYQTLQLGKQERRLHCTYDLVNETSMIQAAALLERCALFIGIDHGLPHIMAALGKPSVVLFGPGMPIEAEHKGLTFPVETDVCQKCRFKKRIGRKCPDDNAICMHSITIDMVKKATLQALGKEQENGIDRSIEKHRIRA